MWVIMHTCILSMHISHIHSSSHCTLVLSQRQVCTVLSVSERVPALAAGTPTVKHFNATRVDCKSWPHSSRLKSRGLWPFTYKTVTAELIWCLKYGLSNQPTQDQILCLVDQNMIRPSSAQDCPHASHRSTLSRTPVIKLPWLLPCRMQVLYSMTTL